LEDQPNGDTGMKKLKSKQVKKINKTPQKKLQKKAESLWKEVCLFRDKRKCQVKQMFPGVKIPHSNVIQVDHCFSRSNKNLFLQISNGTTVCSTCNMMKKNGLKGVDLLIYEIVSRREGVDRFMEMRELHQSGGANISWNKVWWLEEQIDILETIKRGMTGGIYE